MEIFLLHILCQTYPAIPPLYLCTQWPSPSQLTFSDNLFSSSHPFRLFTNSQMHTASTRFQPMLQSNLKIPWNQSLGLFLFWTTGPRILQPVWPVMVQERNFWKFCLIRGPLMQRSIMMDHLSSSAAEPTEKSRRVCSMLHFQLIQGDAVA